MKKKKYLLFAIVVVGMCLRPSITGLGSLLKLIKPDLGLTDAVSGLLTTIPMIMFALISPFVGRVNRKLGTAGTLCGGFLLIAAGTVIRSFGGIGGLYLGTALIGCGIACGNVLMPAIIKSEFPRKYGLVTALNSTGLAISSAIASGINYPLASQTGLGWKGALCIYAVAAMVAIGVWLPVRQVNVHPGEAGSSKRLMKSKIAWSVTLFLGIEALVFYSCSSWLSTIFQFKGLDAVTAGYYVSCFQLMGIPASFLVPTLAGMKQDQRALTYGLIGIFLAGIAIMALTDSPVLLLIAALMAGFGCNGGFALSMAFIGFRTANGSDAIQLSGMSQSIGYVIAAFGPIGMGLVNDVLQNWNYNLWLIVGLLVVLLLVSSVCAREGTVEAELPGNSQVS